MTFFIKLIEEIKSGKRELRKRGIQPKIQKRLNILITINNDLHRCCKNLITITNDEIKAIRKRLFMIMKEDVALTQNEYEVSLVHLA